MLTPVKSERYISIKADGRFHEKVDKETEGAVLREYELQDGTKGSKWELLYKSVDNVKIKNIKFEDSEYGENILITLSDGENEVVWAENTGTNFATDFMRKLPNINLAEPVSIKPYAFEDGKKRGVSIFQVDKVADFFWDGEKKTNGFPEWPKSKDEMNKNDWRKYFLDVQIFLTDYTKEKVVPKFEEAQYSPEFPESKVQYPDEEIDPSNIPF